MNQSKHGKTPIIKKNSTRPSEVYSIVDGKKQDAHIHDVWMAGITVSEAYRMTSYEVGVSIGMTKEEAAREYLKPGDAKYI